MKIFITGAREFLTALLRTRNVTTPNISLPAAVMRPLARFVERLWRMLRLKSLHRSRPPNLIFWPCPAATTSTRSNRSWDTSPFIRWRWG